MPLSRLIILLLIVITAAAATVSVVFLFGDGALIYLIPAAMIIALLIRAWRD